MPKIYVTGFGPFETISDNPSSVVAEQLGGCELLDLNLEVSLEGVDMAISRYLKSFPPRDLGDRPTLLALGVDAASLGIKLEHRAKNKMNFILPDVNGHLIRDREILENFPKELRTPLDVHTLASELGKPVGVSEDAGEYICNYFYYKALALLNERFDVLFVHVCKFEAINESAQLEVLNLLVRTLRDDVDARFRAA